MSEDSEMWRAVKAKIKSEKLSRLNEAERWMEDISRWADGLGLRMRKCTDYHYQFWKDDVLLVNWWPSSAKAQIMTTMKVRAGVTHEHIPGVVRKAAGIRRHEQSPQ